jgi:putative membrane protein
MWQFLASNLPHATASLNAVATLLLVVGLVKIRAG